MIIIVLMEFNCATLAKFDVHVDVKVIENCSMMTDDKFGGLELFWKC